MTAPRILLFDSGMGGLTVAKAVRRQLPEAQLVYAADNAAFPYGDWEEEALKRRIVKVVGALIERVKPHLAVIACNAASTVALAELRKAYAIPFVGTVPAIKPAAAQTKSGVVGVLATPGTVAREYTHTLIHTYAYHCKVILHGAKHLAAMAEQSLKGKPPELQALRREIAPVFKDRDGRKTDVVVLGCTHYPLLLKEIQEAAPWPVTFIDPAPAIARRVADVLDETPREDSGRKVPAHNSVILTSSRQGAADSLAAYASMGFALPEFLEMPAKVHLTG